MILNWLLILKGMKRQTNLSDLLISDMHFIFMHLLSNLKANLGNNMSLEKLLSSVGLINNQSEIASLNRLVNWVNQAAKTSSNKKYKSFIISRLKKNKLTLNKFANNLIFRLPFKLSLWCNQKKSQNIHKKEKTDRF